MYVLRLLIETPECTVLLYGSGQIMGMYVCSVV